jgi:hypothetical protein
VATPHPAGPGPGRKGPHFGLKFGSQAAREAAKAGPQAVEARFWHSKALQAIFRGGSGYPRPPQRTKALAGRQRASWPFGAVARAYRKPCP